MFEEALLQWDHHQFTFAGEAIALDQVRRIPLDLSLGSSLKWDLDMEGDDPILFELDFGLGESFPSMEDMTPFLSLGLGLDTFADLCKKLGSRAIGAVMLKGEDFFSPLVAWDDELLNDLRLVFKSLGRNEPKSLPALTGIDRLILETFARDTVMGYISLLASQLPAHVAGLIDVRGKGLTPFQQSLLFLPSTLSGMRRVQAAARGPVHLGLLVPDLSKPFIELMPRFEAALKKIHALGIEERFVSADQFHEGWELLDYAVGLPALMSESAIRQCFGFEAAGGEFISLGDPLEGGRTFEDFVTEQSEELKSKAKQLRDLNRQKL